MKMIGTIALIILISGCVNQGEGRTLRVLGGQPQQGLLFLSYISKSDVPPHNINWEKSALKAQKRCRNWGFDNVITPDTMSSKLSCIYMMFEDRCAKFNHLYRYQCIDKLDYEKVLK